MQTFAMINIDTGVVESVRQTSGNPHSLPTNMVRITGQMNPEVGLSRWTGTEFVDYTPPPAAPDAEELARIAYRNGIAADIMAIAATMGFTDSPVDWIALSTYMRENASSPAVQLAATTLTPQALFYKEWGGDLFNVHIEEVPE